MFQIIETRPLYNKKGAEYLVPISTSGELQGFSYILSLIKPDFKEVYKKALRSGELNKRSYLTLKKGDTTYHLIACSQNSGNFKARMLKENLQRFFNRNTVQKKLVVISGSFSPIDQTELYNILQETVPQECSLDFYKTSRKN